MFVQAKVCAWTNKSINHIDVRIKFNLLQYKFLQTSWVTIIFCQ